MTSSHLGHSEGQAMVLSCATHGVDVDRLMTKDGPRCAAIEGDGGYCRRPLYLVSAGRKDSPA